MDRLYVPAWWLIAASLVTTSLLGCGGDVDSEVDETPPEASMVARPACGPVPLELTLDASASREEETRIVGYAWDLEGDGVDDTLTVGPLIAHTYADVGTLFARVRVTNRDSLSASAVDEIWVLPIEADPSICLYRNRRTQRVRGIEYTLGLSKGIYTRADTLKFFYQIRNQRPSTVEFPLHWTCLADFYVFSGDCTILNDPDCRKKWRYTDHEACVNRLTQVAVPPAGTEHFTAAWYPQYSLSPGGHTAFAMLYHGPPNPSDSTIVWVSFEVE